MEQSTPRLRLIREARGLSQRELARRMGIDHSLVSRAERGLIATWPAFRKRAAAELAVDESLLFGAAA